MQTIRPPITLNWLGTVSQGKQLELEATTDTENLILAMIVADEADESLWLELYIDNQAVQIPLETISKAIEAAKQDVRSEAWYEKNIYPAPRALNNVAAHFGRRAPNILTIRATELAYEQQGLNSQLS